MKIPSSAFPVAVTLVGICWLGARQWEIGRLRDGDAGLNERRVAHAAGPLGSRNGGGEAVESAGARMRRLAEAHKEWGGTSWLRTNWGEIDELERMDREQLIALLDAMAETDVEKAMLERRVLDLLEKIDPEYVTRRTGRATALAEWALRDPAGAVAWFEERVAVGEFERQFSLNKSLVWALGTSDPATASPDRGSAGGKSGSAFRKRLFVAGLVDACG